MARMLLPPPRPPPWPLLTDTPVCAVAALAALEADLATMAAAASPEPLVTDSESSGCLSLVLGLLPICRGGRESDYLAFGAS